MVTLNDRQVRGREQLACSSLAWRLLGSPEHRSPAPPRSPAAEVRAAARARTGGGREGEGAAVEPERGTPKRAAALASSRGPWRLLLQPQFTPAAAAARYSLNHLQLLDVFNCVEQLHSADLHKALTIERGEYRCAA